jgi:hypothetical protein
VGDRVDVPAATLEALMDAAAAVLSADSLDETFGRITARLRELVPFDDLVIYEVDPTQTRLGAVFADGRWIDEVMAETFGIDEGLTGHTIRQGETVEGGSRDRAGARGAGLRADGRGGGDDRGAQRLSRR